MHLECFCTWLYLRKISEFVTGFWYFDLYFFFYFLFLVALGLGCCTRAPSSCGERGLLFVVVHGFLIAVASLVAEHGL